MENNGETLLKSFVSSFVDGFISTFDLDQVNQAIALHHAFKNASNPE